LKCLVTGVAGFIGSHLAERLLAGGHSVIGVDCFTDYYARSLKEQNLAEIKGNPLFQFIEHDLAEMDLAPLISDADWVFHQAAQAGVRASWGSYFEHYIRNNIHSTQALLEACKNSAVKRFIYASSSSVYGDSDDLPLTEGSLPRPVSPYGVTKLAGEHLCRLYEKNFRIPTVSLRYFTVYGPRQRPDMAFNLFIRALMDGREILLYGDGLQTRDFTFISDIVEANISAAESNLAVGETINVGGGSQVSVNDVISRLQEITRHSVKVKRLGFQKGDVRHTLADISKARSLLGYRPLVKLQEGLKEEYDWLNRNRKMYEVKSER